MRLRQSEWAAPIVGELRMDYFDGTVNSSRRTLQRPYPVGEARRHHGNAFSASQ